MKLFFGIFLLNIVIIGLQLFWIEQYVFAQPTRDKIEQNKKILLEWWRLVELKEYDEKVYNYYRLQQEELSRSKSCGKEIKEAPRDAINKNFWIYFNYNDYRLDKYKETIKCNIEQSRYSNLHVKVFYSDLLSWNYNRSDFLEYIEKGYKVHFLLLIGDEDLWAMTNVMKILWADIANSLSIYVLGTNRSIENNLDKTVNFYLTYYPGLKIYTWAKDLNREYEAIYIDSLRDLDKIKESNAIERKIFLNLGYTDAVSLDIFSLEEIIRPSSSQISFPNSVFLGKNDTKIEFLEKLGEQYPNIEEIEKEYIRLKYEHYFLMSKENV